MVQEAWLRPGNAQTPFLPNGKGNGAGVSIFPKGKPPMLTPLPAAPPLVGGLGVPVVMATPIAVEKDEADDKKKEGVG